MSKSFLALGTIALAMLANPALAKDTDADEQLREALRQKMAEMGKPQASPAPAAPAVAPKPAAPPAAKPVTAAPVAAPAVKPVAPAPVAAPVTKPVAAPTMASTTTTSDNSLTAPVGQDDPETAAMREALRAQMQQTTPAPEATVVAAPVVKATTPQPPKDSGYAPVVAPPVPVSGTKEQRLQQLLGQYKADQITPSEYHTQRAKIIAE